MHEVLNLSASTYRQSRTSWGRVCFAAVLPTPAGGTGSEVEDTFVEKRPLIGVVYVQILALLSSFPPRELIGAVTSNSAQRPREEPEFIVYSLSSHEVVNRRPIPGLVSFLSNASFIIIVRAIFAYFRGDVNLVRDIEHIKPSNSQNTIILYTFIVILNPGPFTFTHSFHYTTHNKQHESIHDPK